MRYASGQTNKQTDRQTDTLITILRTLVEQSKNINHSESRMIIFKSPKIWKTDLVLKLQRRSQIVPPIEAAPSYFTIRCNTIRYVGSKADEMPSLI